MKNISINNVWHTIPLIPKCIKVTIIIFFLFIAILMMTKQCILIFSFYAIVLLYTLYSIYRRKLRINSTYKWEKVQATVLSKKIQIGSPFGATPLLRYILNIKYKYTYNSHKYISNKFAIETCMEPSINFIYSREEAESLLKQIVNNNKIEIFVNPKDPSDSIILQGSQTSILVLFLFLFLISLLMGLFVYIRCWI